MISCDLERVYRDDRRLAQSNELDLQTRWDEKKRTPHPRDSGQGKLKNDFGYLSRRPRN